MGIFMKSIWRSKVELPERAALSGHMGCKPKWNPEESFWECSCHGSRYCEDGTLKDNPAQMDLKKD